MLAFALIVTVALGGVAVLAMKHARTSLPWDTGSKSAGLFLAACHLALVGWITYAIVCGQEPDWPMLWLLPAAVDFPVSILWFILASLLPSGVKPVALLPPPLDDVPNFLLPFAFFVTLGTLWWFLVPQIMLKAIRMLRAAQRTT